MFATLLMLYKNYEKQAGLNTQGRLHQQPRKDPVNRLSNHLLDTGIFPDCLRIAVVKSPHEKGGKTIMTDYRPVSLMTVFFKYLEKLCTVDETNGCILTADFWKVMSTENSAFR
jgi:hypothetical protein